MDLVLRGVGIIGTLALVPLGFLYFGALLERVIAGVKPDQPGPEVQVWMRMRGAVNVIYAVAVAFLFIIGYTFAVSPMYSSGPGNSTNFVVAVFTFSTLPISIGFVIVGVNRLIRGEKAII